MVKQNGTPATQLSFLLITRIIITDRIELHSVLLPLRIVPIVVTVP